MTIFVEDKLKPGLQNVQLADASDIEVNVEGGTNTNVQSELEALKGPSNLGVTTVSSALAILSYDSTQTLGTGSSIELSLGADITFINMMTSADQVGSHWIIYNNTPVNRRIQLQEINASRKGLWFGDRSFSTDGRDVELLPQETCRVTAWTYSATSNQRFKFEIISAQAAGINSTGSSNVQADLDNGYTGAGISGQTLTLTRKGGGTTTLTLPTSSSAPTLLFSRDSDVLPANTADNTFSIVEETGTALTTITLPDVTSANVGRRITVINQRPDVNAEVRVNFASGDTIPNAFQPHETLEVGESTTFFSTKENTWAVLSEGSAQIVPNFPLNVNNDNNTFMFSVNGDTANTWARDRNTAISLRSTNETVDYQIANPATSGININDEDGYIFRHVSGSNSVRIFPFAAGNTMVIGSTAYTNASPYTLPLGQSLVLLYNTSNSRWEGKVFTSIVGGASGASGSSEVPEGSEVGTEYFITSVNRSGSTIPKATPVELAAFSGGVGVRPASLANHTQGITSMEALDGEHVQVTLIGQVEGATIYTGDNTSEEEHGSLSVGQNVFIDEQDNIFTTEEYETATSTVRSHIGEILSTTYTVPTEVGQTLGTDLTNADDTTAGAFVNKTQDFSGQGTSVVTLPSDTFASVNVGDEVILEVTPDNGQTGIIEVQPQSGVLLYVEGTEYTTASKFSMSSASGKQIRKFVLQAPLEGQSEARWIGLKNSEDITTYSFYFDINEHRRDILNDDINAVNVIASNNRSDISAMKVHLNIPNIVDATSSPSGYTINGLSNNRTYFVSGSVSGDTSRVFTLNTLVSANNQIEVNQSVRFTVENASEHWARLVLSDGSLSGTTLNTIPISPHAAIDFEARNNGNSVLEIFCLQDLVYDFLVDSTGVISSTTNLNPLTIQGTPPTWLLEANGTGTERITFKMAGEVEPIFTGVAEWYTTSESGFSDPALILNKNGTLFRSFEGTSLDKEQNKKANFAEVEDAFSVATNDYFTLSGANLEDLKSRLKDVKWAFKYILKRGY